MNEAKGSSVDGRPVARPLFVRDPSEEDVVLTTYHLVHLLACDFVGKDGPLVGPLDDAVHRVEQLWNDLTHVTPLLMAPRSCVEAKHLSLAVLIECFRK
jgi:hypothetical protein